MRRVLNCDQEAIRTAGDLVRRGFNRAEVAKKLGMSQASFARWLEFGAANPEGMYGQFRAAVLAAEDAKPLETKT